MIITRTPFRVSFFGGGTDYPAFYREEGGAVLSTTINKYCYITTRFLPPFFDHAFRIRYTKREETQTVDQIQHPSVRECLRFMGVDQGIEMVHTSDIPAMSGIGSSSAFTVGFLNSLFALRGQMVTKRKLAFDAIHVEQDMIHEAVGSQDQVAAAFGGLNRIVFDARGDIFVQPVTVGEERTNALQSALMLCFIGFPRYASDIARQQLQAMKERLGELRTMRQMVDQAVEILGGPREDLDDFGRLLHESWTLKRQLSGSITTPQIDAIYAAARGAGALGGKLCGAGGGGFLLLYVPPDQQPAVRAALKDQLFVPFRFESLGSHVIFYAQ
jgi:D-glycero-alpha-D-manno-heptose-7-phosphate kinase